MKITLHAMSGLILVAAGLSAVARAADLDFCDPAHAPAPPEGAPGFPSRDPNLDALPGFQNPPPGYGQVPFWWWTGDPLDKQRLLWQIEQLHEKGIAGMQVNYAHEDTPGWLTYAAEPEIFSDAWWDVWKFVAEACGRRGMGIGLSGYTLDWPNGKSLISRTIYGEAEIQGRELAIGHKQRVAAGKKLACELPADTVAVRAYPAGASGIGPGNVDLKDRVQDQHLDWTPEQGDWEVWFFTAARKPGTLNPIHPLAGRRVVEKFFQPFQDHAAGQSAAGLNYFFHDELHFGVGDRIWADDLAQEFRRRKGYDLFEALPAMFQDVGPKTVKYRLDFMDVKMQLVQERYFIPIFRWHWSRGKIYGCDQGSRGRNPLEFGDYFSSVRWYTAPGHDTPGGRADLIKGKVSSSIAQLYKRPRVWLEGYHSLGWGATPENLMFATRENYLYGCNLLNLHGLYYTTHGSFWEWAPPCYHFRMPYWEHMGVFLKYFERLSYLMSQGVHQCDIAVLYPVAPGQAGLGGSEATEAAFAAGSALISNGYDFLFMDSESLSRAEIRDGRLHVADASYRVLALPAMRAVRWATLQKAQEFFQSGGIVVAGGALPEASDRVGREDPELDAVVKELFGATAAETAAGARPAVQRSNAGGIGIALLAGEQLPARRYDGGFVGRWAWSKEPVQQVYFKGIWRSPAGAKSVCRVRFFCDNEGTLYLNGTQVCSGVDYSSGWTGEIALKDGDIITIDARDHDAPGRRGTAGMFLAIVQDGKTVFSTDDLRYTLTKPADNAWRTGRDVGGLSTPDPSNVHELHRGGATGDVWVRLIGQIESLVPRDVKSAQPIKAAHRKIGPRDVYMVMGAIKNSAVEFRAKGRAELWDPWTGAVQPLRVLGETATGTRVELPLEDYEAQIVVFTPASGRPAVAGFGQVGRPAPNEALNADAQSQISNLKPQIALDGEWEFELKPTMDNRYGDFRLPATDKMIGPEARIFRHAVESGEATAWREPNFDDRRWERVTYDFGPQFWLLGPLPADAAVETLDAELAKLARVNPQEAVTVAGKPFHWRAYSFSWRQGLEGDPGHQGWHGLKENVTDHFLCLGKRENALNEFKYVAEQAGVRYYLWTSGTVDRPTTARIVASARQEGERPHASEVLTPAAVFVSGTRVQDLQQAVSLRAGPNPILVRYDQAGRGYFVVKRDGADVKPTSRTPLAMTWFDDPSVIRFDAHAGDKPAEWFRFTAPPGLCAMAVTAKGNVEAWADGQPMHTAGQGRFEPAMPIARAAVVALRVVPQTGASGAAVFPDPVRLECGPGVAELGDWSKAGALECYSGGAWYRKTVTLTPQQARGSVTLDLGKVVATAEVRVNGQTAGIRVAPPWRVDISKQVQPAENRIEVLVYNTLANHYLTVPTRYRGELASGLLGPAILELAGTDNQPLP
ncbi:MAG TPA: glycosyl hydrolase [Candidatus Anammoximicrobium sp.]|nr:glycosyl hydrolase [Candidatus Anammoximicrobium sp.]